MIALNGSISINGQQLKGNYKRLKNFEVHCELGCHSRSDESFSYYSTMIG